MECLELEISMIQHCKRAYCAAVTVFLYETEPGYTCTYIGLCILLGQKTSHLFFSQPNSFDMFHISPRKHVMRLYSSPEQMLRVSYCDHSLSFIMHHRLCFIHHQQLLC